MRKAESQQLTGRHTAMCGLVRSELILWRQCDNKAVDSVDYDLPPIKLENRIKGHG